MSRRAVRPEVAAAVPARVRVRHEDAQRRLKAFDYMEGRQGRDERVLCKCCASPVAGLVVQDQPIETVRADGKIVVRERLVWAQFSNYAEVLLHFDDGSRHMTALCVDCVPHLTPETAQDCYVADVADLLGRPGADRVDWARWDRTVTRWERVA